MINEFNEISYAKKMLDNGFLSNKKMYEISVLSKYFFFLGYSQQDVKDSVFDFCQKNLEKFNQSKYNEKINKIINTSQKNKIVEIGSIPIYESDKEFVESIGESQQFKQVLFGFIVYSKIREKLKQKKFLNIKYSRFSKSCGISNTKDIFPILKRMEELKLIRICRNSNCEILFNVQECGNKISDINDIDFIFGYFRNIFENKNKYKECSVCGKMIYITNNKRKYCSRCAKEIKIRNTIQLRKNEKVENRN